MLLLTIVLIVTVTVTVAVTYNHITELVEKNTSLTNENSSLSASYDDLSQEKEILDKEVELLQETVKKRDSELSSANEKLEHKESELKTLIEENKSLKVEVEELISSAFIEPEVEESSYVVLTEDENNVHNDGWQSMNVEATAYSTNQPSLSDYTFTEINLRENPNVVAVDPNVIPLGSTVIIEGLGEFIAGDTGADIIGNRIDIHMTSLDDCYAFGRRNITILFKS